MESETVETTQPQAEEEPQVFSVVRDGNGSQFTRRDFIEKAAVTSAAVMVVGAGCTTGDKSIDVKATIDSAISATENANKLTQIAGVSTTKEPTETTVPTDTPVPTKTLVPTRTPVPPTATVTPTEKPKGIDTTIKGDTVNFRSGPGTGYNPITRLPQGTHVTMVSRLADNSWVGVALADPKKPGSMVEGWIKTSLLDTQGKDLSSLPVITNIPPTPTPLPGRYGNTGAGEKGIDYQYTDQYGNIYNFTLPCGAALPAGATCTCNCITVPRSCSCVDHTNSSPCSCNTIHYWYPN